MVKEISGEQDADFSSRPVESNQEGVHEKLAEIVNRHLMHEDRTPIREHNRHAFDVMLSAIKASPQKRLIMDSCCGTGMSTLVLAEKNPDALVIGIDQSSHRLSKRERESAPDNCLFLQANCEDIWRLSHEAGLHFDAHYVLYPNPYPKSKHLKRRWHGHPSFAVITKLASTTVLRSNWRIYLEEFQQAWQIATGTKMEIKEISGVPPMTLFEKKYGASGQRLYELSET